MKPVTRIIGVAAIFGAASVSWFVLGASTEERTRSQTRKLDGDVTRLWGKPLEQEAPRFLFRYQTSTPVRVGDEIILGQKIPRFEESRQSHERPKRPDSSALKVHLGLDQRTRGLLWYSLYNVRFQGTWTYTHDDSEKGHLHLEFKFPDAEGLYDDFTFAVDGKDLARHMVPVRGRLTHDLPVRPGQTVTLRITYSSRGQDSFRYLPGRGVTSVERFHLAMTTDFADIDYPTETLSPSSRVRDGKGWRLQWRFKRVITSHGIGMIMPAHIQPGELSAALSFSAPVSLFFFFAVILILATLRRIEIHPINYLLLASAFFAFHLLFAYLVDHLLVVPAFLIASVVSVALVVSYLRLVVSPRFAFLEAALAQMVYLVGFALAHFWEGYTGLTITVLVILTLFLVMQLTGRLKWSELLAPKPAPPAWPYGTPGGPGGYSGGPGGTSGGPGGYVGGPGGYSGGPAGYSGDPGGYSRGHGSYAGGPWPSDPADTPEGAGP